MADFAKRPEVTVTTMVRLACFSTLKSAEVRGHDAQFLYDKRQRRCSR